MKITDKRAKLANTHEEKDIFFGNWTNDNIKDIAFMRSEGKLDSVHELSIDIAMRNLLDYICNDNPTKKQIQSLLYDYWYLKAKAILKGYSEYSHPLCKEHKLNLLSEKGSLLLHKLGNGQYVPVDELKSVGHKDNLDLSLFIDLHFDPSDFISQEYKFLSPISGCPYQCIYCAENSPKHIYCMPYPIYLKILSFYSCKEEKDAMHIGPHNDSEALMYYDSIICADLGDISFTSSKWQSKISILTKGAPLGGIMDLALSKRYYSRNKPSISKVNISLLENDNIERNLDLAFNVQKIATLYNSEHRLSAKIFASPDNLIKYSDKIKKIKGNDGTLFWAGLEPIGRAKNVKEAHIRLTNEEIKNVLIRAGFKPGEISTNMNFDFGHSRYLTADGHMQLDAFGRVYMKSAKNDILTNDILYDIYEIQKSKVR